MRFSDSRILSGTNSEYSSWGDMDPNASPLSPEKPGRRVARVEKLIEYIKSINTTEGEKMKTVNDLINRATPSTALEVLQWINSLLLECWIEEFPISHFPIVCLVPSYSILCTAIFITSFAVTIPMMFFPYDTTGGTKTNSSIL